MSKTFSDKNRQKFRCHFFLGFFCFVAFPGVSQRWEFKDTTKNVLETDRVEKFLQKNRPKIQNRLFPGFFYHVFGRFSVRGVQKHDQKISENEI
jgi:hypothetical protein